MKISFYIRTLGAISGLLFCCSCVVAPQKSAFVSATKLPADTAINQSAGRGGWLYVTLHLKDRPNLLFLIDTGSPYTILEKSLEPKLGKSLGNMSIPAPWYGTNMNLHGYRPPKLYLGNTRLMMGDWVLAGDFQIWDGPHVSGILGMDCLRHYCVQLNFADGKILFLDPNNLKTEELGKAFPLLFSKEGYANVCGALAQGENTVSEIDTGVPSDGALVTKLFEQELKKQPDAQVKEYKTTTGITGRYARFSDVVFDGETYTNLTLDEYPAGNVIGLRFLARHLVTLNFPKQTMYLKQTSIGPPAENLEDRSRQ